MDTAVTSGANSALGADTPDQAAPSTLRALDEIHMMIERLDHMADKCDERMAEISHPIARIDGGGPCLQPRSESADEKVSDGGHLLARLSRVYHELERVGDRLGIHADELTSARNRLNEAV